MTMKIRVEALTSRFSFDGQTAVQVLAGTRGVVSGMMVGIVAGRFAAGEQAPACAHLTVSWDSVIVQDKYNNDFAVTAAWEECDIDPRSVRFIGSFEEE